MKKFTLISLVGLVLVLCTGLLFAQNSPRQLYQEIFDVDGVSYPDNDPDGDGEITFRAWMNDDTEDVLTHASPGCRMQPSDPGIYALIQLASFQDAWRAGYILHIEIFREKTNDYAYRDFVITGGSLPIFLMRRTGGEPDESIALRPIPVAIFDSNVRDEDGIFVHRVGTNANFVEGFNPDENGKYRATGWAEEGKHWQIQLSTLGCTNLSLSSVITRQFAGLGGANSRGPQYFMTSYSMDGEEWTPHGNPDYDDWDDIWFWEILNENREEPMTMAFDLPEECNDQENLYVRWSHLEEWGGVNRDGWSQLNDVRVAADKYYDLRISVEGNGTSSPQPDSTYTIFAEKKVKLTAIADTEGWIFDRWIINNDQYDTLHVEIVMDKDYEATAHFIQFPSPNPVVARNPNPEHNATNVPIDIEELEWTYTETYGFINPRGFRVYMNTTGEFGEDDGYVWVPYVAEQTLYSTSDILPDEIEYRRTYYWKVIPTTIVPRRGENNSETRRRNNLLTERDSQSLSRGDAANCPVWTFTTQLIPDPVAAINPTPAHRAVGVSIDIERVRWEYVSNPLHSNPIGFRIYGGTSPDFDEDEFDWIPYVQNQTNYHYVHGLEAAYNTTYYWQIIPTTISPFDRQEDSRTRRGAYDSIRDSQLYSRGDAEDCPIWYFTIEQYPAPVVAANPKPAHDSVGVSVELEYVSWDYVVDTLYVNPVGFRVYFNTTSEFDEEDFDWIDYVEDQVTYRSSDVLTDLDYETDYYWQVIPTTISPFDQRGNSKTRRDTYVSIRDSQLYNRGDAEDCPVWKFTTERIPAPAVAVNPKPAHESVGVPVELEYVSWDYVVDTLYVNPIGFRVYFNTTDEFDEEEFDWIDYVEDQVTYRSSEVLLELDLETDYYWQVIPTTIYPFPHRGSNRTRKDTYVTIRDSQLYNRGDAEDCPVWKFTTSAETGVESDELPVLTTKLSAPYPNPFNPRTTFSYALAEPGTVTIELFNSRGQKVLTLFDGHRLAGVHQTSWNGKDSSNKAVSSGLYLYRMRVVADSGKTHLKNGKMMMLK